MSARGADDVATVLAELTDSLSSEGLLRESAETSRPPSGQPLESSGLRTVRRRYRAGGNQRFPTAKVEASGRRSIRIKLPPTGDWRTTDEDEINRRRLRARDEQPRIRNLDPNTIFSNFEVRSRSGMTYYVEIRTSFEGSSTPRPWTSRSTAWPRASAPRRLVAPGGASRGSSRRPAPWLRPHGHRPGRDRRNSEGGAEPGPPVAIASALSMPPAIWTVSRPKRRSPGWEIEVRGAAISQEVEPWCRAGGMRRSGGG